MMDHGDSSSNDKTDEKAKTFSANLKQIMDSIPKLACVIVAAWDYFHTRDIERFVLLLAIGHTASYSLPKLKTLAPRAGTLARTLAAWLDKVKP